MNVSFQWLQEYVEVNGVPAKDLAEKITRAGIEIDGVHARGTGLTNIVVGYVQQREKHPDADKLSVCQVEVGAEAPIQIVCGAANVAAGQKVPVAMIGAVLPGDFKIKKSKLRGVESHGMICSANELGIPEKMLAKSQTEGILVLPADAPVGADAISYLGLDDHVLLFDLTPNRSDCLSMLGVAYEVAALLEQPVKLPQPTVAENMDDQAASQLRVSIAPGAACSHYSARLIKNVTIKPSPQWMQNRLIAAGIRPINNVVDITNYVMLEYGQPMHAFDWNTIQGGQIVVRQAEAGEVLVTLDKNQRELQSHMLVIADGSRAVALAGVMGGAATEVTAETTSILLESARFDGAVVRITSKQLGLRSESSARFEKEVDPARVRQALDRASVLLMQLAGGTVSAGVVEAFRDHGARQEAEGTSRTISIRAARINQVLGTQISAEEIDSIWGRLHFPTEQNGDAWDVSVPSRRNDIRIDVDLIEEVARIYGYDRIPTSFIHGVTTTGGLSRGQQIRRRLRSALASQGWHEVFTYSFISPNASKLFSPEQVASKSVAIALPMSEERSLLRQSLLSGLVETATYNRNRQADDVKIFEVGNVFHAAEGENQLPLEQSKLALLWTGSRQPRHWSGKPQAIDFFDLKGQLDVLFEQFGIEQAAWQASESEGLHPGRTAKITVPTKNGVKLLGIVGQLHPNLQRMMDLNDTYVAELDMHVLTEVATKGVSFEALPKFPSISRDMALVMDRSIPNAQIISTVKEVVGEFLASINVFDVYEDDKLGADKRSVAFALVYRSTDRTLTDEEVSQQHFAMVDVLRERFGVSLRG